LQEKKEKKTHPKEGMSSAIGRALGMFVAAERRKNERGRFLWGKKGGLPEKSSGNFSGES